MPDMRSKDAPEFVELSRQGGPAIFHIYIYIYIYLYIYIYS